MIERYLKLLTQAEAEAEEASGGEYSHGFLEGLRFARELLQEIAWEEGIDIG